MDNQKPSRSPKNEINNFHNHRIWTIRNPHAVRKTHFHTRFSVVLRAGIINHEVIGTQNYRLEFEQQNVPGLVGREATSSTSRHSIANQKDDVVFHILLRNIVE
ncbi:hypothetical protein QE152_g25442 [Popillia japonica]|uniref:Uncharacterized protein n=1 Tax=Popillia japonica TaxID=7064 RepID=A0AAW1K2R4_POPJA